MKFHRIRGVRVIVLITAKITYLAPLHTLETNTVDSEYLGWCKVLESSPLIEFYAVRRVDFKEPNVPTLIDMFDYDEHIRESARFNKWKRFYPTDKE